MSSAPSCKFLWCCVCRQPAADVHVHRSCCVRDNVSDNVDSTGGTTTGWPRSSQHKAAVLHGSIFNHADHNLCRLGSCTATLPFELCGKFLGISSLDIRLSALRFRFGTECRHFLVLLHGSVRTLSDVLRLRVSDACLYLPCSVDHSVAQASTVSRLQPACIVCHIPVSYLVSDGSKSSID